MILILLKRFQLNKCFKRKLVSIKAKKRKKQKGKYKGKENGKDRFKGKGKGKKKREMERQDMVIQACNTFLKFKKIKSLFDLVLYNCF